MESTAIFPFLAAFLHKLRDKVLIKITEHCGGAVKIIASIEDPAVIAAILDHLRRRDSNRCTEHAPRAPPKASLPPRMD